MRLLLDPGACRTLENVLDAGEAAWHHGLDGVLLSATHELPAPLVSAAALASRVPDLLLAVEVVVGERHPIELAEEAIITDTVAHGRLILAAAPAPGFEDRYGETLDLLRHAFAARPFRFEGEHWVVPAGLPENVHNVEELVRVTPTPPRARVELWGAGSGREEALARGLGHLAAEADSDEALAASWAGVEGHPWSIGSPRARRLTWRGAEDALRRLAGGRKAFGQDWAAVRADADALEELAHVVRPRIQLDRLPPGLEQHWDETRPWLLPG
jgi:alkanesulfonate monooxygenase SsuD/methylene tetrahydromethanopterin reductase-like flavin-dependent oxidoreductase (luciferase family)